MMTFTKADSADHTQPAHQDRITANVWITRAINQGIYNIATENTYIDFYSPEDTEWAYGTTANLSSLVFDSWENTNGSVPPNMVGQDMVLHLITDDIYIDIKFTSWTQGGAGGGFSYERSTPVVSIDEFETAQHFDVFPQPAGDQIYLGDNVSANHITIYNISGQMVREQAYERQWGIDISSLPAGVYVLITDQGGQSRFMKE